MKLLEVDISEARNLEHAMDLAIKKTEEEMFKLGGAKDYDVYRIRKVKFITLEAVVNYEGNRFTYKFEATLDES